MNYYFCLTHAWQVYLSFWPDGCAYAEAEPILVSDGSHRRTGGADVVRIARRRGGGGGGRNDALLGYRDVSFSYYDVAQV